VSGPDDVAASLIAALTDEGEAVDEGSFTLDPAKAREKLREYQLADAHEWILLAISAGHVATDGRGPVRVRSGSEAEVWFPGVSLTAQQLENCFAAAFGRTRGLVGEALTRARVLRLLGIAGNAALSLGSTELEIESVAPGGERHVLHVSSDGVQKLEHERRDAAAPGIRMLVRGGRGQRRPRRERELVRERCRLALTEIFVGDDRINRGLNAAFDRPVQRVDVRVGETVVGKASFESRGTGPAKVLVVNRGVLVETVTLAECTSGFVAVVHVDLPMDLSQRQILREQAWDELMAAIRATHDSLPRPRLDVSGLDDATPRPWRNAALVAGISMALGVALVVTARWLGFGVQLSREQLAEACKTGDRDACLELIGHDADLETLLLQGCQVGDMTSCVRHAERVHAYAPAKGLDLLINLCEENGLIDACRRALPLAGEQGRSALNDHLLCIDLREGAVKQCRAWIARARRAAGRSGISADLREALRAGCMAERGDACLEGGWMAHLGYGGPRSSETAEKLFRRGCTAGNEVACEWAERRPVSDQSCANRDAWACYSLGIEAFYARRTVLETTSVLRFEQACEFGLSEGCEARALVKQLRGQGDAVKNLEHVGPKMVLPGKL
jgi:hypothetical protein